MKKICISSLFLATTTISCSFLSSCQCGPDFSLKTLEWSGSFHEYEPSYSLYQDQNIQASSTLPTYLQNNEAMSMWCQDILYSANTKWQKYPYETLFYRITIQKFDILSNLFSYTISIRDQHSQILTMKIQDLEYSYKVIKQGDSPIVYFLPVNMDFDGTNVYVDDEFYLNTTFKINILEMGPHDEPIWQCIVDFNLTQMWDRVKFQEEYAKYLIFSPFFYSETKILV